MSNDRRDPPGNDSIGHDGRPASAPPPQSEGARARGIARCSIRLDQLRSVARDLDIEEVFSMACPLVADALPLDRITLRIGEPPRVRTHVWSSRAIGPNPVTIEIPQIVGQRFTLSVTLASYASASDHTHAEALGLQLRDAIALGRAEAPPSSSSMPASAPVSRTRRPVKVLLVDDNDEFCRVIVRALEVEGHRVRRVGNGLEALAAMQLELPAVMLLDMNMPVMDGLETRRRQLDDPKLRDVPVIVTSADHGGAFDSGVVLLEKPFATSRLLALIDEVVSHRRTVTSVA